MEELTDSSQFNWQNLLSELAAAHPSFETDNKIDLLIQQRQESKQQLLDLFNSLPYMGMSIRLVNDHT
jgi:hypothetical protein